MSKLMNPALLKALIAIPSALVVLVLFRWDGVIMLAMLGIFLAGWIVFMNWDANR